MIGLYIKGIFSTIRKLREDRTNGWKFLDFRVPDRPILGSEVPKYNPGDPRSVKPTKLLCTLFPTQQGLWLVVRSNRFYPFRDQKNSIAVFLLIKPVDKAGIWSSKTSISFLKLFEKRILFSSLMLDPGVNGPRPWMSCRFPYRHSGRSWRKQPLGRFETGSSDPATGKFC